MSVVLAELNCVVGGLSADKARQVLDFARSLEQKQIALPANELLEWTEDDLREWSLNSLRNRQADHFNEESGELIETFAVPTWQRDD